MCRKAYFIVLLSLVFLPALAQDENFTLTGHVSYKNRNDSVRVRLSCTDGRNKTVYTDSLGNYSITRGVNKDLQFGIKNGILNCAVLFEPPEYKRCGHCPFTQREQTIDSDQSRRLTIKVDSIAKEMVVNATITEKMTEEYLPVSIDFKKRSALFSNYFAADTLLDCVADYLLNCNGCSMEIAGYADNKENNTQQLAEQRAEKVYSMLLKRGVNAGILQYKSYTESVASKGQTDNKTKYRVDFLLKK
ncbi:MAG: OmpA family protein [Bacteroidia bacterium]